jgi:hypothetical protein
MRSTTSALLAFLALGVLPTAILAQPTGALLTSSDITSEHLIRRPVEVAERDWLGLTIAGDRSAVGRFDVRWTGTVLFGDSVFTLVVTPSVPHLLVADVPNVAIGPATTVVEFEESLSSDQRMLDIVLADRAYRLELGGVDPMYCDATVTLSDGRLTQTLYVPDYTVFSCDEPHFSVQWAGDLDGDGRLDLVATFSPKYSWYPRHLYLSSAAPAGMLVGLVAVLEMAAA